MSTTEELKQNNIEEPTVENQEEVEEEEPVDQELQAAMKNVKLDENIFRTQETKEEAGEKGKASKNSKVKKNKGVDFLDYANKNGIQISLEYEEKANQKEFKKKEFVSESTPKEVGKTRKAPQAGSYQKAEKYQGNYNGEKRYPYKGQEQGQGYVKKPYYPKRTFNKTGNNKFDLCNMHLPKMMHMMQPVYNPYTLHGGMIPQYMPPMGQNMPTNVFPQPQFDLPDTSDNSVTQFLEHYLSLENLNQDLYLRNRIDENGFIEVSEIANHNKLRYKGVTADRIFNLFSINTNPLIESVTLEDGILLLRNRDWENIKDKLIPTEYIQQQKKMMKNAYYQNQNQNPMTNLNYVSLQNNYFFNGMPQMGQENMGMGGMYMGAYQHPAQNMPQPNQNIPSEENGDLQN